MAEREVVFVDGVRTAFGRMGGTIRDFYASRLGGIAIKGLIDKTKITEKAKVDSVFMGAAMGCSHSNNPARFAMLYAGLDYSTTASYVEMQCGSAIDSINHAAWKILANHADIVIAGGMEAYSQMYAKFSMSTTPFKLNAPMPIPQRLSPTADENIGMGETAENLQKQYDISRLDADKFAFDSQTRAQHAMENDYFKDEIVPITIPGTRKTPEVVFDVDEHPRPNPNLEIMSKLPPAFRADGTVTAGNASGQNDGGACVLMMSAEKAKELGYEPMARWIAGAEAGVNPKVMGIAPAYAMPIAMKRAGLSLDQFDVIECNEAFAVQNLAVIKEVENQTGGTVDRDKWNPNGGAIAFGHPNGASGARICMFAMRELIRNGGQYGMFSSCCGGGLGTACVFENLQR